MESAKARERESEGGMKSVEEPEPKKRKIDDYGWKIFYHASSSDVITDLDIPSIKIPITLSSLLSFCYASDSDLFITSSGFNSKSGCNSSSSSSSDKSESPTYHYDSIPEKLSRVFAQDGKLCIDQILPLLPPAPEPNTVRDRLQKYYCDLVDCAELALSSYNRNNRAQYELVAPLTCDLFYHKLCFFARHINFLAKPKNADANAPPDLFFAEVAAIISDDVLEKPVFKVSIMKPHPRCFSSSGAVTVTPLVFHPDDDCFYCKCNLPRCDSSSDDDEEATNRAFSSNDDDDDIDMYCVFCSDEEKERM